jgi:hypothetical protein
MTCTTPCETAETSNTPLGIANTSSHYPPPQGEPGEPRKPQQQKGGGVELSHALIGMSTSYSEPMGHKKAEGNKSSMTDRS